MSQYRNKSIASDVASDDGDNFIIGDRVWVQGNKPGYIQYIGEVEFAPGEWAGIVLDRPEGKNSGIVNGVRYFQCESLRGLFTKPHRLSRYPLDINGNPIAITEKPNLVRRICSPDGKITTTVTRVTQCGNDGKDRIPHYMLPTKPSRVITTVTTTTTTSVHKKQSNNHNHSRCSSSSSNSSSSLFPVKSALKSSRSTPNVRHGSPHHVHF